jgi:TRAP-type mannitol/chloroaromatic compound transport system permease large subunit
MNSGEFRFTSCRSATPSDLDFTASQATTWPFSTTTARCGSSGVKFAAVFSNFHLLMGAGRLLNRFSVESGLPPIAIILLMQLSMVILGMIIDEMIIVIVCAPLYTPIAVALGYDPVWFGILMIINMSIAVQTPPYGFALFYLKAVAPPDVSMAEIYKSIAPFVALKTLLLAIVMLFPPIATWLPKLLFD